MRAQARQTHLLVLIALVAFASGCPGKEKTLRATLTGVNAARDGFVAWDDGHQQEIVAGATSLEDGQAKLTDYRAKRERVLKGFEIAYKALAVAALDPTAANVAAALAAAKELYDLTRALMAPAPAPASAPSDPPVGSP